MARASRILVEGIREVPGPKRTVAVGRVDAIGAFTAKYGNWDIGGGLGAMLATAVPVPAVLGWFDARAEFIRLGHDLVRDFTERRSGLSRHSRTQRLAAARHDAARRGGGYALHVLDGVRRRDEHGDVGAGPRAGVGAPLQLARRRLRAPACDVPGGVRRR